VHDALAGLGPIEHDRLGSVVCTLAGPADGPRVMLGAHLDEVGFLVQSVGKDGEIAIQALGGWWGHVLPAQRVEILTRGGVVPGVIGSKPPHFLRPDERERVQAVEAMYVDVGATSREDVERLAVEVGDPIVPRAEWCEMAVPGVVSCKALDNRIGVGLMCDALGELANDPSPTTTVVGVATVQEELGARGARTASQVAGPDVAIVLEATPADDNPGATARQASLGAGPQVRMFDPTAVANRRLVEAVRDVARAADLPLQVAVRRTGGTDAQAFHVSGLGVPTVVVGVPTRYIHTHVALARWSDYEAAFDLIVALVRALDGPTVARLTDFGPTGG
jgi:endoglucanase